MPFDKPFQEFEFHFVQRDPDVVEAHVPIYYKDNKTGLLWFVPEGERGRCDGQSIPKFLWSAVGHPLEGEGIRAAFLHDFAYKRGTRTKKEADVMFYHALLEEKDDHPYAKYLAVKFGGFVAWRRHRKAKK